MYRNSIVLRVLGALILIGFIIAGGAMAYRAGVTRGITQAPAVATAISQAAENAQPVPPMYDHGYGYGYPYGFGYRHHFNPFGAICFSIFFLFLFFGALRFAFFRPWRRGWGHHGHWGKWEGNVPPIFDEWHKRAHEGNPADEGDKKE